MNKEQFYKELLAKNGILIQGIVAIEELSELQKEITKTLRNKGNTKNLIEEIADVEIMIEQLKIHYNIHEEVETMKTKKIIRTIRRLKDGEKQ